MDQKSLLGQTQTLSPQMIQSMELLQMSTIELQNYLQEQLQENPALEFEDSAHSGNAREKDQLLQKLEWLHSSDVQNNWYNRQDAQDLIDLFPDTVRSDFGEESLYDHLRAQISFKDLSPGMAAAVECVLQSLEVPVVWTSP